MSSDSDIDASIQAPVGARFRRGRVPRPKGRPFAPNNRHNVEDSSEDEPIQTPGRQRKGRKRSSDPGWGDGGDDDDLDLNLSDEERPRENHPPPTSRPKLNIPDSDEEGSIAVASEISAKPRPRKRLSTKRTSITSSAASGPVRRRPQIDPNEPPPDPETLKQIYSSCINLFQSQKINVDNAFQLNFLELMGDIIELPDFDKQDMLGAGRMLEAGAKIYVCRVEKTKSSVMDLASTLNIQRNKKVVATDQEMGEDGEPLQPDDPIDDGLGLEAQDGTGAQQRKRKKKAKDRRFVCDDVAKISLSVEVDIFKGAARRSILKTKFEDFIENDIDFDYYNGYLVRGVQDIDPEQEVEVDHFGEDKLPFPPTVVDFAEMCALENLPFRLIENFDELEFDVWGKPLVDSGSGMGGEGNLQDMELPADDHIEAGDDHEPLLPEEQQHVYEPQENQPEAYREEPFNLEDGAGLGNDTFVSQSEGRGDICSQEAPVQRKFNNLQEFFELYGQGTIGLGRYGPNFVKAIRAFPLPVGGPKKPRQKREPVFIDVKASDRKLRNKFITNKPTKGIFDERSLERWSCHGRSIHPFLEIDQPEDEFERVLEILTGNDDTEIPEMFKCITDPRRHILNEFEMFPERQEDIPENEGLVEDVGDDVEAIGFEFDRHQEDDHGHDASLEGPHMHDVEEHVFEGAPIDGSFPMQFLSNLISESEREMTSCQTDTDSVKFTKKPKPIDMHGLKRAIKHYLEDTLQLDPDGKPTLDEETCIDFISMLKYVYGAVDIRTAQHLSISIVVVGLLHVVVDKKLFVLQNPRNSSSPLIVCRGRLWNHVDHIPHPVHVQGGDESD